MTLALHQRGAGKAFVFQHGLCGDSRQTFEAVPDLPGWQLTTLDCAGHGQSPLTPPYSIARFANDIIELIETMPSPVVLGGISMGAAIALRIAVKRPDLVRGLVLVRPAWLCDTAPVNMQPNAEVGRMIAAGTGRATFENGPAGQHLAQVAPDNLASLLGFFDREPLAETARLLTSIAADGPGLTGIDLTNLKFPVLVCGTAQDAVHPLALARDLAALIPGAKFIELPPKGADRPAHLAALHAAITTFLQEF